MSLLTICQEFFLFGSDIKDDQQTSNDLQAIIIICNRLIRH